MDADDADDHNVRRRLTPPAWCAPIIIVNLDLTHHHDQDTQLLGEDHDKSSSNECSSRSTSIMGVTTAKVQDKIIHRHAQTVDARHKVNDIAVHQQSLIPIA